MSEEKIALITGANRGIGLETALQLGKAGVHPVLGTRSLAQGKEALEKLTAAGIEAELIKLDVNDAASRESAYEYLDSHYGRLDILINNAGIAAAPFSGSSTAGDSANDRAEDRADAAPIELLRQVGQFRQLILIERHADGDIGLLRRGRDDAPASMHFDSRAEAGAGPVAEPPVADHKFLGAL